MSLQSRKGNPAVAWACVIIIAAIIINDHVSSAPVAVTLVPPTPSQKMDFYENLYNHTSMCSAILPRVLETNYIQTKVNNACNDTDAGSVNKENLSSVCSSLSNLFPKLCHLNAANLKVNRLVKPAGLNILGINKFCTALKETITNVTESSRQDELWIIPFSSNREMQGQMDASQCEEYCLNVPTREFQSDKDIRINPTCALLLKGFKIYLKLKNQGTVNKSTTKGDGETIPAETSNTNEPKELIPSASEQAEESINDNESVANKDKKDMRLSMTRPDTRTNSSTRKKENESVSNASKINMEIPVALESITRSGVSQKTGITVDVTDEKATETKQTLDKPPKPLSTNVGEENNMGKQTSNALNDETIKSPEEEKINEKATGLSASTTTTTAGTVDLLERLNDEGPAPPIEKDEMNSKGSSSTAVPPPKTKDLMSDDEEPAPPIEKDEMKSKGSKSTAVPVPKAKELISDDDDTKDPENVEGAGIEVADDNPDNPPIPNMVSEPVVSKSKSGKKVKPKPNSTTKNENEDAFASLQQEDDTEGPDYNQGEIGIGDETAKKSDADDVGGNDMPKVENRGYDSASGRYSNNGYGGAVFEHGTTINVSLNEAEDTGFFNYFLFFVTFVGLLYFVIHNKKKLIAYVMEGKRPRSRSRRSSSSGSGQYRRLDNNYD